MHSTETPRETAILAAVAACGAGAKGLEDSLEELALLAATAGARVTAQITQSLDRRNPATYMGSGKVEMLRQLVEEHKPDMVIFDDDLSPVQMRNLERTIGCKLLDRSALILDIFARRARTATAKTQVELAQLDYLRTRLTRHWTHLSRQQGGIGMRGPGETQIETDRRLIGQRMATLRERLKRIERQRATQRRGRQGFPTLSLVGYTNTGKSTLFNMLSGSNVLAEDQLFATLDASTRRVTLASGNDVLLSDTVGFIRKLPHRLIASFKSTLAEVAESDMLVHVVDVTHPRYADQIAVVNATLEEIGASGKPTLLVFNKMDAVLHKAQVVALQDANPESAFVSALYGAGLGALKARLTEILDQDAVERIAYVPVTAGKALARVHRMAEVLAEEYVYAQGKGVEPQMVARIRFRAKGEVAGRLRAVLAPFVHLMPVAQS